MAIFNSYVTHYQRIWAAKLIPSPNIKYHPNICAAFNTGSMVILGSGSDNHPIFMTIHRFTQQPR